MRYKFRNSEHPGMDARLLEVVADESIFNSSRLKKCCSSKLFEIHY